MEFVGIKRVLFRHAVHTAVVAAALLPFGTAVAGSEPTPGMHALGALPLRFEPNVGQAPQPIRYVARGNALSVAIRHSGVLFHTKNLGVVGMRFEAASSRTVLDALERQPGVSNYLMSEDRANWRTGVPHFGRVRETGVYPGIDVIYYGNGTTFEYDFAVAPGADPNQIRLRFDGVRSLHLDKNGDLLVRSGSGDIRQHRPVAYQEIAGHRVTVDASYRLTGQNGVALQLGRYDKTAPLVIDPIITFASYLGGTGDEVPDAIVLDQFANIYMAGITNGTFPSATPTANTTRGQTDIVVLKLNAAGTQIVYATYIGGTGLEAVHAMDVDTDLNVYVTGYTNSTNFPTVNAIQSTGDAQYDAYALRLDATGKNLVYSTYLGSPGTIDLGLGIAVDRSTKNAYIVGSTSSPTFPGAAGTLQGSTDTFVVLLNPNGARIFATRFGGNGIDNPADIAVTAGGAYFVGRTTSTNLTLAGSPIQNSHRDGGAANDSFLAFVNSAGGITYASYMGLVGDDLALALAVDASGAVYVAGSRGVTPNIDTYIAKVSPSTGTLVFQNTVGGNADDQAYDLALDAIGNPIVVGQTASTTFPVLNAVQNSNRGGRDAFVYKYSATGSGLLFSTYYGSIGTDAARAVAASGTGDVYVAGVADASITTVNPIQASIGGAADMFILRLGEPLRFVPIPPCRIADTRYADFGAFGLPAIPPDGTRTFDIKNSSRCVIPDAAVAYSLNVTAVPAGSLHYLTIYPTGQERPLVSTLNSLDGRIKANAAIVPAGLNGSVSVFARNATTNVILDINGYFVPANAGIAGAQVFYPMTPCRLADTRFGSLPLGGGAIGAGQTRNMPLRSAGPCNIPAAATSYALNVTVQPVDPRLDYLTIWPSGPQPVVSTLNATRGETTANMAILPAAADGSMNVYANNATHVIIDIFGYFAPPGTGGMNFYSLNPCRVMDTRDTQSQLSGDRDINILSNSCGAPVSARAYSLNATVVPLMRLDYLTLWPQGTPWPNVSTLNSLDATITSNAAIIPTSNGSISARSVGTTHLILDMNGYFAP